MTTSENFSLTRPIDAAILAYFRIAFGALMFWELIRYLAYEKVHHLWVEPSFHFTYFGFSWVTPLPEAGLYTLMGVLLLAALFFTVGFLYRISALIFAIGFTYLFLLDQAKYLNHFYLICLLSWISVFLPANSCWSLDAKWRPKLKNDSAPAWTLNLLRFQVAVVYFYGGLAKLNADWLQGEPMRTWLANRADWAIVGELYQHWLAPYFFSYGGLLFDLLIVPALLWKRTRVLAFAFAVFFHLSNSQLFTIGIFPWMGIAITALFFDPSWPRKLVARFRKNTPSFSPGSFKTKSPILVPALAIYITLQLTIPLRHFFYPGNVSWTEEGHRFSWHMMLRSKKTVAATFVLIDENSGDTWKLDPTAYLTPRQLDKMLGRPDMIQQFCAHIASLMKDEGYPNCTVRAVVYCSLNGRPPSLLVDPKANLATAKRSLLSSPWILPLNQQTPSKS